MGIGVMGTDFRISGAYRNWLILLERPPDQLVGYPFSGQKRPNEIVCNVGCLVTSAHHWDKTG